MARKGQHEHRSRLGDYRDGRHRHADHVLPRRHAGATRRSRPERDAGLIWFVTDLRSGKEHEIEAEHDVGLVFIDAKAKAYLSITARAEVRRDHAKAAEIWKRSDNMWWNGPDDPNVCVLRVRPLTAELWDGPASAAVAAFEFVKARITGEKPNLGENRKVTVRMTRAAARANPTSARANGRARPIGSSGRRSAPASGSLSATMIVRARSARTSWATKRPAGGPVRVPSRRRELQPLPTQRRLALLRARWYQRYPTSRRRLARRNAAQQGAKLRAVRRYRRQHPGDLDAGQPLPFGSPRLRPPRQPGE